MDDYAELSLVDWMCAPSQSERQAGRDPPSNFNLASTQSSRDNVFFMAKHVDKTYFDTISLASFQ